MTPNELYSRTPEDQFDLIGEDGWFYGHYGSHIPEIEYLWDYRAECFDRTDRLIIKVYKHFDFDHRRYWRLASIWLDEEPVMIIRNAGREGDDHQSRFVTNEELYKKMVRLIFSLYNPSNDEINLVDPTTDIKDLTSFYGNSLDGYFERFN